MARPRVFVSSTYYDLKHIRASLDLFIESMGMDSILSEKGDIAYAHDVPLDESCYREVGTADLFVLILGGRYGSPASDQAGPRKSEAAAMQRYDSITKKEFQAAVDRDIPIYVLIESSVHAEFQTFRKNRDNTSIEFAHVDSPQVFALIDELLAMPRNNPIETFDRYADIEGWLRGQWAGLFRDLLTRRTAQQQLTTLAAQVGEMKETNQTLKNYLEAVMTTVAPETSDLVIRTENERLSDLRLMRVAADEVVIHTLENITKVPRDKVVELILKASSINDLVDRLIESASEFPETEDHIELLSLLFHSPSFRDDINRIRNLADLPTLSPGTEERLAAVIDRARKGFAN